MKTPRIAIYYFVVPQTGYRNDGPPLFMNYNFRKLLNGCKTMEETRVDMGSDTRNVVHLWPGQESDKFGTFDLNVLVDHGEDAIQVPLDWKIPSPNAYWVSDAHVDDGYRMRRAKQFDHVFVCQKRFIDEFVAGGVDREKIHFLPHAAEPDVYKPYPSVEKYDWSFIGHLNNEDRINLIDRFTKELPNWYLGWRMPGCPGWNVLDDVARKFGKSKIILNESIKDDINMRTFEALACKRALVTEWLPTLGDLFEDGKHLRMFRTADEALAITRELLVDEEKRNAMAQAGYDEVLSKHTYMHRAKEILKTCLNYEAEETEKCLSV